MSDSDQKLIALSTRCFHGGFCVVADRYGLVTCVKCGCRYERFPPDPPRRNQDRPRPQDQDSQEGGDA